MLLQISVTYFFFPFSSLPWALTKRAAADSLEESPSQKRLWSLESTFQTLLGKQEDEEEEEHVGCMSRSLPLLFPSNSRASISLARGWIGLSLFFFGQGLLKLSNLPHTHTYLHTWLQLQQLHQADSLLAPAFSFPSSSFLIASSKPSWQSESEDNFSSFFFSHLPSSLFLFSNLSTFLFFSSLSRFSPFPFFSFSLLNPIYPLMILVFVGKWKPPPWLYIYFWEHPPFYYYIKALKASKWKELRPVFAESVLGFISSSISPFYLYRNLTSWREM